MSIAAYNCVVPIMDLLNTLEEFSATPAKEKERE